MANLYIVMYVLCTCALVYRLVLFENAVSSDSAVGELRVDNLRKWFMVPRSERLYYWMGIICIICIGRYQSVV